MRIMFFCWAEVMRIDLVRLAPYLPRLSQDLIIAPLMRLNDEARYKDAVSQLNTLSRNVSVVPVYLKSPDSRFRNLVNPNVMLRDSFSIFKTILRSKPDIVVCFYVTHAYPLVILKRIFKFYLCVYAMGSDVNIENDLLHRLVRRFIFYSCELIFCVSSEIKHKIEEVSDRNVILIPSSADPSFFRPLCSRMEFRRNWGFMAKSRIILTVCILNKMKGVDVLIRSLQMLDCDDFCLLIVGEGPERKSLEELAGVLGFKEKVRFLGFRSKEELLELYNLADLFVLASYSEGLPRVIIEAMSCGCIPIVSNVGGNTAVVRDGFNGFTVNLGDHGKLGERIRYVLSLSEEETKVIQSRARLTVEKEYDSRKTIEKMVDKITALFENPSGSRT